MCTCVLSTGQHDKMRSPFDWYVTSRNLVAMSIVGVVFFIITLLCELKPCRLTRYEQNFQRNNHWRTVYMLGKDLVVQTTASDFLFVYCSDENKCQICMTLAVPRTQMLRQRGDACCGDLDGGTFSVWLIWPRFDYLHNITLTLSLTSHLHYSVLCIYMLFFLAAVSEPQVRKSSCCWQTNVKRTWRRGWFLPSSLSFEYWL